MGRTVSAVGITAALLFGGGMATTASAATAQPSASASDSAASVLPGEWQFAGNYATYEKCRISGRSSGYQFRCEEERRLKVWKLYIWADHA
ncbi:hypothetical protein ACSNOK_22805 [Streptomyces sp. URMC 126]|uniref:hypothetical protein n=1 Tax=Streptomyces sp. URMC 126 TaxID=3423401 RepID=UPI003F1C4A94